MPYLYKLIILTRRVEIQHSLNCNQLLAEATMKIRRPDGIDVIGMEELDGAEDAAEEGNSEYDIESRGHSGNRCGELL